MSPGAWPVVIGGTTIAPGETRDLALPTTESYFGASVEMPVHVIAAEEPGPTVLVTGAIHGDEINGTGVVRSLVVDGLVLRRGAVVFVPVVNTIGFEQHTRYMPDRRDLNRVFPGSSKGSMAARVARAVFDELVLKSDFAIDLHTAVTGRVNFPHVRADMRIPQLAELARAFGCEVIVDQKGNAASLRRTASKAGVPTLLLEAGEAAKIEPGPVAIGERGVRNVLRHLGMLDGELSRPAYQTVCTNTHWVRAKRGGLLRFHVSPGSLVRAREPLATIDNLLIGESSVARAPFGGVVLGLPTWPAVKPGEPICHIAKPDRSIADIERQVAREPDTLHRQVQSQQAGGVAVVEPEEG